jgi:hypothetical protein
MRFGSAASLVLAFTLPAATGCETTPKDRLQGKWVGERVDSFAPDQAGRAQGWAQGTTFEFKGSRVTITIPAESPREGTFHVASAAGDDVSVTFMRPHGLEDQAAFRFENEERLRWMLGDGRSVLMRRID